VWTAVIKLSKNGYTYLYLIYFIVSLYHREFYLFPYHHLGELEETTRMPSYYVDEDYPDLKSKNLSLNEAIDVAQNRPLWRLMSTFGAMHS